MKFESMYVGQLLTHEGFGPLWLARITELYDPPKPAPDGRTLRYGKRVKIREENGTPVLHPEDNVASSTDYHYFIDIDVKRYQPAEAQFEEVKKTDLRPASEYMDLLK